MSYPRLGLVVGGVVLCCAGSMVADDPKSGKVPYEVHTGYFLSNQSGLTDKVSFLAITDQTTFDRLFGKAVVMGKKEKFLPKNAFDTRWVVAVVKQGNETWKYQVENVSIKDGVLTVQYTATAQDGGGAKFASPLIISVDHGNYATVEFVENGKKAGTATIARPDQPAKAPRHTNRLARETSPYLLQHAHNPVDWYPWGPEAFAKAKKEGKLIFLSIGYSSCYWCHVMERESFENPEVAKLLNDWFICIKVDREERPDVDHIYMTALTTALRRRGGWPMSMFLTADGKPIDGGTYWPPDDKKYDEGTAPGFKTILKTVHDIYTTQAEGVQKQADRVAGITSDALAQATKSREIVPLDRDLIKDAISLLTTMFDPDYGGFGSPARKFLGTKFPTPPYLELLQYEDARVRAKSLDNILATTLEQMAQGGIYDQLGGGFHRYSTERTWTVPHFEKMLYDNAQLTEVYARAFARSHKPLYRRVVQETLAFVERELTSPEGAFYSALDAETDGVEGRFYVWTDAELAKALSEPADPKLARAVFGIGATPNFEGKYHILTRRRPLAEVAQELKLTEEQVQTRLERLRQRLLSARSQRPRPFRDTKVLTAWNGQMIAGYAAAGEALGEPKYVAAAERAATFVLEHLRNTEGRLLRVYGVAPGKDSGEARLNGYLDDYAFLVHGLLRLHDVTKEQKWLDVARSLTDTMVQHYADNESGGFYYTANDHEKLFARGKDQHDGAQPSGNSVAALNLVRLWIKTGDNRYRVLAEKSLRVFALLFKAEPTSLTTMGLALGHYLDGREKK